MCSETVLKLDLRQSADVSDTVDTVYVNGRFLGRPMTGVERFAMETLRQIDALQENGTCPDKRIRWHILAPRGVKPPKDLKHISFENVGSLSGHLWEQIDLLLASRSGVLVNFCNSGPVLHGRSLTVLHDALIFRFPQFFRRRYRFLHQTLSRLLSRHSQIVTVSEFSRRELADVLRLPPENIVVAPNAANHMDGIEPDTSVVDKLGLRERPFLLFVGSPSPNKNLVAAISAFRDIKGPDAAFVLVGAAAQSFIGTQISDLPPDIIRAGRISDEQVVGLYRSARALVFPSIYEGFGIPPLEAMKWGCPVIASDIPSSREVCGDAAIYFDPHDISSIRSCMQRAIDGQLDVDAMKAVAEGQAASFSWKSTAETIVATANELLEKGKNAATSLASGQSNSRKNM